jgi:hypothetical protein
VRDTNGDEQLHIFRADGCTTPFVGSQMWLLLVTGLPWVLFSIIVFRVYYTIVGAVSILFGFVVVAIAANEIM